MMKQMAINQQLILDVIFIKSYIFNNFNALFPCFSQVYDKFIVVLFHSFVVKSNIFFNNYNIMVASSYQVFKHNNFLTIKFNVYFNNFSILVVSIIQIYQFVAPCYFIHSQ